MAGDCQDAAFEAEGLGGRRWALSKEPAEVAAERVGIGAEEAASQLDLAAVGVWRRADEAGCEAVARGGFGARRRGFAVRWQRAGAGAQPQQAGQQCVQAGRGRGMTQRAEVDGTIRGWLPGEGQPREGLVDRQP